MHEWRRDAAVALLGAVTIGLVVAVLRGLQEYPNPTIAALLLLLLVMAVATAARLRIAVAVSLTAMLAFNFFLLPPFHTLAIADPQNWVALLVFLAVANVASHLSASARRRTSEAEASRREVTRLFELSRDILLTTDSATAIGDVARCVARRFELGAVGICLPSARGWEVHQGTDRMIRPSPGQLDAAYARLQDSLTSPPGDRGYSDHVDGTGGDGTPHRLVPLRLGTRPLGLLATLAPLDGGTLDAVGGVVAIAIERGHFLAERKESELQGQRADLAAALLASFSHDLRTPVTSVRVAVANLQDPRLTPEERHAQSRLALQELDRLTRLFEHILDMARIDAAAINPERQWVSSADLVEAAVSYVGPVLADRELEIDADSSVEVLLDPRLTSSALAHLLENAVRYSPADRPILVRAWPEPDGAHLTVRDHGPGLDPATFDQVFEPFYRSAKGRHGTGTGTGTGLGLAIARGLLAAEGGRVWCENVAGGGAQFTVVVPADTRILKAEVF